MIHVPSVDQIDAVNQSAAALPPGASEIAASGLETVPFAGFPLPRLAGARAAFGGKLVREVTFPGVPQMLLIIEAACAYIEDHVLSTCGEGTNPDLCPSKLAPLAKLGRMQYTALGKCSQRARPS